MKNVRLTKTLIKVVKLTKNIDKNKVYKTPNVTPFENFLSCL